MQKEPRLKPLLPQQEGWTAKPPTDDAAQNTRHSELPEGILNGGRENIQRSQPLNNVQNNVCQTNICQTTTGDLQLATNTVVAEWGDSILEKDEDCYRIVSKNIGSLGVRARSFKEDVLKSWMNEHQISVTCIQEVNINWARIRGKYRIYERFKQKDRSKFKLSFAYNKNENNAAFQQGGVCVHSSGSIQFNSPQHGQDPTSLGRWTWTRYQGSQEVVTRIISLYIPCKNMDPNQPGSVYAQHRRYYLKKHVNSCPIENLKSEFLAEVKIWIDKGERVIICGDFNEDLKTSMFVSDLEEFGITSVMQKHNEDSPATQNRGSCTIDGIFVSKNVRVVASGFSDFGDGPGDHRTVFVDIPKVDLEGNDISPIQQMPRRRLISTDVKVSGRFNKVFLDQIERNSLLRRTQCLHQHTGEQLRIDQMVEYEKIERIMESAFKCSNKRCRKLHAGNIAFAPEDVQKYGKRIRLWELVIQKKTGCHVNYSRIRRLAKQCKIKKPMNESLMKAKEMRKQARKKYYRVRPYSSELRKAWLKKKADQKEEDEGIEAAKYLRQLLTREDIRDSYGRINVARKKYGSGGTQKLMIPSDDDSERVVEVTSKLELEDILMETNYKKFSAAGATPLAKAPYIYDIGATASTGIADSILHNHRYASSEQDPFIKMFLQHCQIPNQVRHHSPVSAKITTMQHVQFWKKQDERTQSAFSGMHFGFFKTTAKNDKLAEMIASLVSIPFETGYSPNRWRQSVNVHLLKKPGEYSPNKQRTIHLIEGSLSEGCKIIFSRRMMWRAKLLQLIPDDQFAKKNSKSSDAALLNVLLFDHMRLTRTSGVSIANDLNSCYDRMVHTVASLALRRIGAPKSAVRCMSTCIQYMRHHIRTAYGDSKSFYGGKEDDPLQGGGQGNPAAPPMWIAITVVLLSIMNSLLPGLEIISPITLAAAVLTVIMYVDDSTIFVIGRDHESNLEVMQRAQKYMNLWCKFLWVTGGALRPEKCWYTFVKFKWNEGFWRYDDDFVEMEELTATDANRERRNVARLKSSEGARILGVRIAADGNNNSEKDYLMKSTEEWAEHIRTGYLTRYDAALALRTTISKTWQYPLVATNFPMKDALEIMVPAYKAALPKMGCNRNLPRVYRYAPIEVQGLGLPHIYTMQGVAHIKTVLGKMSKDHRTTTLLIAQLEYLALEMGNMNNIFSLDYATWKPFTSNTWMTSTWEFCSKYHIYLDGPRVISHPQRENDGLIMEKILEYRQHFTELQLRLINQCRVFLRLMYLSDMVSGDGKVIEECFVQGKHPVDRETLWKWPYQHNPSCEAWVQWRRALSLTWGVDATNRLCSPRLGKWRPQRYMNMTWFFSYDTSTNMVYRKINSRWINYSCITTSRSFSIFEKINLHNPPTSSAQRVSVFRITGNRIYTSGYDKSVPIPRIVSCKSQDWWHQTIHRVQIRSLEVLDNTYICASKNMIRTAILDGSLSIVCDGSYFPDTKIATAAFVIEDIYLRELGKGYCRVNGDVPEIGPYRAELGGVHLVLNVLKEVCRECAVKKGSVVIYCDCEAVIKMLWRHPDSISITTKQYDLLWDITYMVQELPLQVKFQWVKGHQSKTQVIENQFARMNDSVDNIAKKFARYCIQNPREQRDIEYGKRYWHVMCNGQKLVNNLDKRISYHVHAIDLFDHLQEKYDLNDNEIESIDWQAIGRAMQQLTLSEKLWTTKHVSHFNGLGKKMLQCHRWESGNCPRCQMETEDHCHLISCPHETCQAIMGESLLRFSKTLKKWNTHPLIRLLILKKLRQPNSLILDLIPVNSPRELVRAAEKQDLLGPQRFIEGRLVCDWSKAQQMHYTSEYPKCRRTGLSWAAMVIRNILRYCRDHWLERNKYVQENRVNQTQERLRSNILNAIEDEFEKGIDGIALDERFLFDIELTRLQKLSFAAQKDWLDHVYTARQFFGEHTVHERTQMQRFMERWRAPRRRRGNPRT